MVWADLHAQVLPYYHLFFFPKATLVCNSLKLLVCRSSVSPYLRSGLDSCRERPWDLAVLLVNVPQGWGPCCFFCPSVGLLAWPSDLLSFEMSLLVSFQPSLDFRLALFFSTDFYTMPVSSFISCRKPKAKETLIPKQHSRGDISKLT